MIPVPIDTTPECFAIAGHVSLRLVTEGTEWVLDTPKATLLAFGVVPLPLSLARFAETYELPGKNDEEAAEVPSLSADPVLVDLARRMWIEEIRPGEPVHVNSPAVAAAAEWEIDPERFIFRRKI